MKTALCLDLPIFPCVHICKPCILNISPPHITSTYGHTIALMLIICKDVPFKPLSVTNNSVGSRTAAAGNLSAAVVFQVACSGRLRTDAVTCN